MEVPLTPSPSAMQFQPLQTPTLGYVTAAPKQGLNFKLILTVLAVVVAIAVMTKLFNRREGFAGDYTVAPTDESARWDGIAGDAAPADFGTGTPILENIPPLSTSGAPTATPEQSSLSGAMDLAYADNASPTGARVQCNPITSVATDLLPKPETQGEDFGEYAPKALKNQNFLEASRYIGANNTGSSLRLSSRDLRQVIPNPRVNLGPFNNSTVEPDKYRRPLE